MRWIGNDASLKLPGRRPLSGLISGIKELMPARLYDDARQSRRPVIVCSAAAREGPVEIPDGGPSGASGECVAEPEDRRPAASSATA